MYIDKCNHSDYTVIHVVGFLYKLPLSVLVQSINAIQSSKDSNVNYNVTIGICVPATNSRLNDCLKNANRLNSFTANVDSIVIIA